MHAFAELREGNACIVLQSLEYGDVEVVESLRLLQGISHKAAWWIGNFGSRCGGQDYYEDVIVSLRKILTFMRYLAAALLVSLLSSSVPAHAAQIGSSNLLPAFPAQALQPSRQNDQYLEGLRGLWNLPGGGYFVDIRADGPQFYSYADAGKLCWPDQALTSLGPSESPVAYYAQSAGKADTVFTDAPDDMQFHAQAVAELPSVCGDAIDRSTPLDTFDAAVASLHDYYSFSAARHVDWAERGNNLRPAAAAARNDEELAGVFSELLDGLQDVHTSIAKGELKVEMDLSASTVRTHRLLREAFAQQVEIADFSDWFDSWTAKQNDAIYALLSPQARGRVYGDAFLWGTLAGNVGYLAVSRVDKLDSVGGVDDRTAVAQTLDRALGEMQGTRALVLDISMNTGGSTDIIAAVAARFADRRRLVYTRQMPKDAGIWASPTTSRAMHKATVTKWSAFARTCFSTSSPKRDSTQDTSTRFAKEPSWPAAAPRPWRPRRSAVLRWRSWYCC